MSIEQLKQNGYIELESGFSRDELQTVMNGFRAFIELPDELKAKTHYWLSDRGDGDFGYFQRVPGAQTFRGTVSDNKDIFHFGASTRQMVEAQMTSPLPREMRSFLDDAESIFWQAQATKRQALGQLGLTGIVDHRDGSLVPYKNVFLTKRALCNDVLRLIHYYDSDGILAKPHLDRSAVTLAIGESHAGLRIAPCNIDTPIDVRNERLSQAVHADGQAKFFLGAGWATLRHESHEAKQLPLGWHDVMQTDQAVDTVVRRWSAILFSTPHLEWADYSVPGREMTRPQSVASKI